PHPASFRPALTLTTSRTLSLLGTWHVVASTLPLWKNKKNVAITYSAMAGEPATTFDDLVTYQMRSAKAGAAPSTVKGIDRLEEGAAGRWKWKRLLMIATSKWQLLGFRVSSTTADSESHEPEWVVTYFASTLFTPAGLDIYSRSKDGLSDAFVEKLIEDIGALGWRGCATGERWRDVQSPARLDSSGMRTSTKILMALLP
ncbi:hypothetical protein FB451DRAFT_1022016, partial [Mycena latifolia]